MSTSTLGKMPTKVRNSNLELFRIVSMFLIVAHHYVVNSGLTAAGGVIYQNATSLRSVFLLVMGAWGKIGINCFVLITGYFMCKSNITAKKFAKLLGEVMFYRITIGLLFIAFGYQECSPSNLLSLILPIKSISTGFTAAYLVFFLCIPFLNVLIHNLNEKMHIRAILICSFTYIFLGTVPGFYVAMNYVSWFIVLYFIASYIRLYPKKMFDNTRFWGITALVGVFLCTASVIGCAYIGEMTGRNMAYFFVTDSNTFLAVFMGISAFMFFKNINIKNNKLINTVAASSYGVLLIHANGDAMRQWLWNDLLKNVEMYFSDWLIVHSLVSCVAIYIICTLIDYLRIRFVETPVLKIWDKHFEKVKAKYINIESKICEKLKISN